MATRKKTLSKKKIARKKTKTKKKKAAPRKKAGSKTRKSSKKKTTRSKARTKPTPKAKTKAKVKSKPKAKTKPKAKANPAPEPKAPKPPKPKKLRMPARERRAFRGVLVRMREKLTNHIEKLKGDSLKREDWVNSEEDGTDAYERQMALSLASSENDSVFEIDEALRRIDDATYGVCEECGCLIEKLRLQALPFVRLCVQCQSERERGRVRFRISGPAPR